MLNLSWMTASCEVGCVAEISLPHGLELQGAVQAHRTQNYETEVTWAQSGIQLQQAADEFDSHQNQIR
jgi:hypothetical protein